MRLAGLDYQRREVVVRDGPEPSLGGADEVLFRVQESGICGSDRELAAFRHGYPPPGEDFLILGHEALGQVIAVGSAVSGLACGDWVVPMVRRPCHPACDPCARGRRDLCSSGRYTETGIFGRHGYLREYASDAASDLVRVPAGLASCAVLMEPLSVVEKAIETALRIHQPGARTALVLGAGPIGILAALVLSLRGLEASVYSLEPPDHPRARLAERAGVRYHDRLDGIRADIVIEATGSPAAAFTGFGALASLGVYCILGSPNSTGEVPFTELMRHNQTVFGSVNAGPEAFAAAVRDLARLDRDILGGMIQRSSLAAVRQTVTTSPSAAVKIVHVVAE
jgi:threonine dehydrogenase-like Zn-dependent dehydrogenase